MLTVQQLNETCPYALSEEIVFVKKLMGYLPPDARVVMIGAGPGVFALAMLEERPDLDLTVVEIDTFEYIKAHLQAASLLAETTAFILGDSKIVGKTWLPDIDFLIIDGDHEYEGVKGDCEAWLDKVGEGGFVLLHDYPANLQNEPTGVRQAVDERDWSRWEKVAELGISIVYRRSGIDGGQV